MAFSLQLGEPVERQIKLCLREQLEQVDHVLDLSAPGKEHFHQARKRLKKARALLRLVRFEIGEQSYRLENGLYRQVAQGFSVVRDAQVLPDTLETLLKHSHRSPSARLYAALERLLERESQRAAKAARESRPAADRAQAKLRAGVRRINAWAFRHAGWKALAPGLAEVYRKARRAFRTAYERPGPVAFHEWRKQSKYLRHQLEFVSGIWEAPLQVAADQLHNLGDWLGEDHDLFMLRQALEAAGLQDEELIRELDALMAVRHFELRALAKPLGEKLFAEKPSAWGERLQLYWKASSIPRSSQKRQSAERGI